MKRTVFLFLAVLLIANPAFSSSTNLPSIIESGFTQYSEAGPKEAIEAWTKGSAVEGSKEALAQANNFRQIQDFYGKYIGFEFIGSNTISDSTSVIFINIKYEKGNVFSTFYCYKNSDKKTVINNFNFHTKAEAVWPEYLIYGSHK